MFTTSSLFGFTRGARGTRMPPPLPLPAALPDAEGALADDPALSAGWHDSSWDLRCGVEVDEDGSLAEWEAALRGA